MTIRGEKGSSDTTTLKFTTRTSSTTPTKVTQWTPSPTNVKTAKWTTISATTKSTGWSRNNFIKTTKTTKWKLDQNERATKATPPFPNPVTCSDLEKDIDALKIINLINNYREEMGLSRIPHGDVLCEIAFMQSWDQYVCIRFYS